MVNADWRMLRTGSMLVLLALVILAVKARLPDTGPAQEPEPESGIVPMIFVHVVLVLAAVGIAVSILTKRRPLPTSPSDINELRRRLQGSPKSLLLVVAAVAALMFVVALSFAIPSPVSDQPLTDESSEEESDREVQPPADPAPEDLPTSVIVLGGLLLVLTAVGVVVAILRRPAQEAEDEIAASAIPRAPSEDTLARAAAVGLAAVSEPSLGPRAAIIACYLAMEAEFASDPEAAPLDSDTPSEVLARAVRRGAVHDRAAADLVGLFTEARFSTHEMTEDQRQEAVRLLHLVERDLGARHTS